MPPKTLKYALIGCGRVAGYHIRAIEKIDGIETVAVCDLNEERAHGYSEKHGMKWYKNYHTMLTENPEIDIVGIITPSGMHYEHAVDVMRRYKKHIVVEKPTFMHPDHLKEAYDLAEANNLKIFPVFQNRHNKAVQRVKEALTNGELGEIRIVAMRTRWCREQRYYNLAPWRGTFSHDGGCLTNQSVHHIDLLRHLGGEVGALNAVFRTLGADVEVEDTAVASLTYPTGAVGVVEATTAARPTDYEASLSLVCEKGLAQLGGMAVNELEIFTPDPNVCVSASEVFADQYGFGHITVYANVVADLNGKAPFPVTRDECAKTLDLLHAFYRSDETKDWVNVAEGKSSSRLGRPNEEVSRIYRTPAPEMATSK